jgi:predicted NBD/HSP70 family sugar kinase
MWDERAPATEEEMDYYAGIDVSLDTVNVCMVDGMGKILREAKVPIPSQR